ncbi:putative zinc metalloprotease Rip3 [Methanimicrococcus sp. At1]|uniref:Zinc metalloprotease n=1 Tax=Methanimicrococcus hacksteinii TaxID=3028293 RepID=A0ABU3VPY3_9EURY|nr:site-2 protease family protein [Methanimicrococcus sp. At1]MDV0445463.1 putative zinc metalloprotease Rip3 [Methanimicrococcus sp. At1]
MSYKVATVKGIPIYVHITFLLVFLLFAFIFAISVWPYGFRYVEPPIARYILACLTALLFFVTLLIHELSHSLLANSYGLKIQNITLFFFGGISAIENPENVRNIDPSKELNIALAGPLSNIIIGAVLLAFNYFVYGSVFGVPDVTNWVTEGLTTFTANIPTMIFLLGTLNLLLGFFNILPIYPMDGGRVLRAWLAKRNTYEEATNTAVSIGKGFSVVLAVIGIFTNWWLAILALFLYISAAEEGKMFKATTILEDIVVKDIMTTEVLTVDESMPLVEFINFVFQKKHPGYPVIKNGRIVGMITVEDTRHINEAERYAFTVKDIMKEVVSVHPDATALDAFNEMGTHTVGRLVVLDSERNMVGIISRTDLMTAIYLKDNFKNKTNESQNEPQNEPQSES